MRSLDCSVEVLRSESQVDEYLEKLQQNEIYEQLKEIYIKELGVYVDDNIIEDIIHDEKKLKAFKEMGYL